MIMLYDHFHYHHFCLELYLEKCLMKGLTAGGGHVFSLFTLFGYI